MRESMPMATATSLTSAPVFSHSAEIELIDEMRCARKALATSLDSCGHCESDKCREVKGLVVRRIFCQHRSDNTMKLRMVLETSFASIALGWIGARDWTRHQTHTARARLPRTTTGWWSECAPSAQSARTPTRARRPRRGPPVEAGRESSQIQKHLGETLCLT